VAVSSPPLDYLCRRFADPLWSSGCASCSITSLETAYFKTAIADTMDVAWLFRLPQGSKSTGNRDRSDLLTACDESAARYASILLIGPR